ncbi:MAG TPA: histidinol-phosphatase [Candidatus Binatia bacterium]|jgi:myo-inositol-1(or 4)-monophosphatase|nr:histidinol-phosphatase [Candidatus Binatia bacterium]
MQPNEFTDFIRALAENSGQVIKPYFARADLAIETKEDQTLVTQADRQAEAVMRELIRKKYPQHGILGEEFGAENIAAEFVWTLDPIDGTISFARGCPLFGTLIGLLHSGEPILGAINHPVLNQLCIGNNTETMLNGRVVRLRETNDLSQAMLLTTDLAIIGDHQRQGFEELLKRTRLYRTWGDCYGYLLVASGGADIMLDPMMNPWDILPLIPIIQGASGVITTWSGTNASQGNSCVAANKTLHPQVLEILNS